MDKKRPELLAPAGTPEAAWAALTYGADAVYAGLTRFSARADAGNFTVEALDELIGYAHHLNRRVYVTFNTLQQEGELDEALATLSLVHDLAADGVIIQDIGIARLIRTHFPQLRLHASTQLAVHNLAGTRQLAENGFSRVVLARELSLREIAHISRNCGIETEVFIHGALCYSYSGLCLFSSHQLGRSGNRGRCAYCCRQPFQADGQTEKLPFSMKDFSAANQLHPMVSAGVASLKIEGRMKSPLYVAAVTDFYRRLADGKLKAAEQAELLADIQTIFGRPATELYLNDSANNPVDPVNDGNRGALIGTVKAIEGSWLILHSNRALQKHDGLKIETTGNHPFGFGADEMRLVTDSEKKRRFELPADAEIALRLPPYTPKLAIGAPVYCSFSQAVRQRYTFNAPRPGQFRQRRPLEIHVALTRDKMELTASAKCKGQIIQKKATLAGPFDPARQPDKSEAALRQCFEKTGDTDWTLGTLHYPQTNESVFVPASILNEARRRLIADFSARWNEARQPVKNTEIFPIAIVPDQVSWSVKTRSFQPVEGLDEVDEWVLELDLHKPDELEKMRAEIPAEKIRLALPAIIHNDDLSAYREWIDSLPAQQKWEAANIGGLRLLKERFSVTADWSLYTLNTQAALQWTGQGVQQFVLSPEDDAPNIQTLVQRLGPAAIVLVYQHTPLMVSATRPAAEGENLVDRSNNTFRIEQNGREYVLVGETPFSLVDQLGELKTCGARHFRIDLCYGLGTLEQKAGLIRDIIAGRSIRGHSGNFARTLK